MIYVSGIIIIDALRHGVVDDLLRSLFVNPPPADRKPHIAHSQPGKVDVLKLFVDHNYSPLLFIYIWKKCTGKYNR